MVRTLASDVRWLSRDSRLKACQSRCTLHVEQPHVHSTILGERYSTKSYNYENRFAINVTTVVVKCQLCNDN